MANKELPHFDQLQPTSLKQTCSSRRFSSVGVQSAGTHQVHASQLQEVAHQHSAMKDLTYARPDEI